MKSMKINEGRIELVKDDITEQKIEAVVNAANKRLAPGGGVAGAIHKAAGPELYEECKEIGGCGTGEAKITGGYELPADHVIHTVGPVYSGSEKDEADLRRSYRNSLELALENDIDKIAFPSLSTGAFGYPTDEAAEIALDEIKNFLEENEGIELVRMVLYSQKDYEIYEEKAERVF